MRVSAIDLGFLSTSSILEKRRQEGQAKVTKGHPQALEVRESEAKVEGRLQKVSWSSHMWHQQLLGGTKFQIYSGGSNSAAGGRRSATRRDLTGFEWIKVRTSFGEVGLGLGGYLV